MKPKLPVSIKDQLDPPDYGPFSLGPCKECGSNYYIEIKVRDKVFCKLKGTGPETDLAFYYLCPDCGDVPFGSYSEQAYVKNQKSVSASFGTVTVPCAGGGITPVLAGKSYALKKPASGCECGAKKVYNAPPKSNLHSSWCPDA